MASLEQFNDYKKSVISSITTLILLLDIFSKSESSFPVSNYINSLGLILDKLKSDNFKVLVVGEFSTGKSTFLNAILKQSILPTDVSETTATINIIKYGETPKIELKYRGIVNEAGEEIVPGETEIIPFDYDKLIEYTTSLEDDFNEKSQTIEYVNIFYPTDFCKNEVELVDTPGLNSTIGFHEKTTLDYLENGHCAIMLLKATMLLSKSEIEYLKKFQKYINKILFVVNKIDRLNSDFYSDEHKVSRLKKLKDNFNRDEDFVYYPLSALRAEQEGWDDNFISFVDNFKSFLASSEKSKEMLFSPVIQVNSIVRSLTQNLKTFHDALNFSPGEFDSLLRENMPKFNELKTAIRDINGFIDLKTEQIIQQFKRNADEKLETCLNNSVEMVRAWDRDMESFKQEMPEILKLLLINTFEEIKEEINLDISILKEQCSQRFSDFIKGIEEYKLSIIYNTEIHSGAIQKYEENFVEEWAPSVLGGAGLGVIITSIIGGPIGLIASFLGGTFLGGYLEEKKKAGKLQKIASELRPKLESKINSEVPKIEKQIKKSLSDYKELINEKLNAELNNIGLTINAIKKDRMKEEQKVEHQREMICELISNIKSEDDNLQLIKSKLQENIWVSI